MCGHIYIHLANPHNALWVVEYNQLDNTGLDSRTDNTIHKNTLHFTVTTANLRLSLSIINTYPRNGIIPHFDDI